MILNNSVLLVQDFLHYFLHLMNWFTLRELLRNYCNIEWILHLEEDACPMLWIGSFLTKINLIAISSKVYLVNHNYSVFPGIFAETSLKIISKLSVIDLVIGNNDNKQVNEVFLFDLLVELLTLKLSTLNYFHTTSIRIIPETCINIMNQLNKSALAWPRRSKYQYSRNTSTVLKQAYRYELRVHIY